MKKTLVLLVLLAGMWQGANADFPSLWEKNVTNTTNILDVRFSHNSQWLLCMTGGNFNTIFDASNGNIVKDSIPVMVNPYFSADDSHLIGVIGKKLVNFNLNTYQDESNAELSDKNISITYLSKDERYLVGGINDGTEIGFRVWDLNSGKIVKSKYIPLDSTIPTGLDGYKVRRILSMWVRISCDNNKIYIQNYYEYEQTDSQGHSYRDGRVIGRIFDFNSLDSNGIIENSPSLFFLSSNCQYYAIDYRDSANTIINIYDMLSKQLISSLKLANNNTSINGVKFTSDDKYLVTALGLKTELSVWVVATGKLLNFGYGYSWGSIDVSNDMKYIAGNVGYALIVKSFSKTDVGNSIRTEEILFPNPTNGEITTKIILPTYSTLNGTIINERGDIVGHIPDQSFNEGANTLRFDFGQYPSGTYMINLSAKNYNKLFKVIVSKY